MPKSLKDFISEALETVAEVTPASVLQRVDDSEWMILDVREEDEFLGGHIPGAVNIPRGFLEVKADLEHKKRDERLADRTRKIICYCGGGFRSVLAAQTLQQMGFEKVESMAGGWAAWEENGFKSE
jgi:rhodanese-related sulfurtransferase